MWPRERWLRKHIVWLIVAMVFLFVTLALGAMSITFDAMDRPPLSKSALRAGIVTCFTISLLTGAVFALLIEPTRRHVARHCRRVCPNCLFVLTKLPERGTCPECGAAYDIEQVKQSWYNMFDAPDEPHGRG